MEDLIISKLVQKELINSDINAKEVRLIDANGEQVGIMPTSDALLRARAIQLDLVEIVPNSNPPVCRIMDYKKYLFEKGKKISSAKKKRKNVHLKEIKMRPSIELGDYRVKLRHLIKFLENGHKVKVLVQYKGREMLHTELGRSIMDRIKVDIELCGIIEANPRMEGRHMIMLLSPRKK
jgi:translation initiation factor IF-3